MLLRASSLLLLCTSLITTSGCLEAPEPTKQDKPEAAPKAEPPATTQPVTAATDQGLKPTTEPLTAEEERLIAADPKTLTPEERRARGHALRKKVMMNPDSDSAKSLNDARQAVLAGEVDPLAGESEDKGLVLQAPPHLVPKQPPADAEQAPK